MKDQRRIPKLVVGVAAGAAVGAGLALLFAPRTGAELRREIHRLGQRATSAAHGLGVGIRTYAARVPLRGRKVA